MPVLIAASLPLAACATSGNNAPAPATTVIPPPPASLEEVEVAPPAVGEPWPVVAAREKAGREEANIRIRAGREDWRTMQQTLGGKGSKR